MAPACPKCREPMQFAEYGPWGCWACPACDRVWMPGAYVRNVLRLTRGAPSIADIVRKAAAHPEPDRSLACPTCGRSSFGVFGTEEVTLHACTGCAGIHFGPGQYQHAFPGSTMALGGGLPGGQQAGAMAAAEVAAAVLAALLGS